MANARQDQTMTRSDAEPSGWAFGLSAFAGILMIIAGLFHALEGIAAIINDEFFVIGLQYAYRVDVTTWGWLHFILGVVVFLAGFAVFSGRVWARVIGIILAILSAVANFFSIPYYPIWAILIIILDIAIIWALSVYGRHAAEYYTE